MRRTPRRPASKAELIARLHRGLRPVLVEDQRRDLSLLHHENLDAIAKGQGTERHLYEVIAGVFTWSRVAELLHAQGAVDRLALELMAEQTEMATRLVKRYGRTGRVAFDGVDYQIAKTGMEVMDQLARITDRPTACAAADWSEARIDELAAAGQIRRPEATTESQAA